MCKKVNYLLALTVRAEQLVYVVLARQSPLTPILPHHHLTLSRTVSFAFDKITGSDALIAALQQLVKQLQRPIRRSLACCFFLPDNGVYPFELSLPPVTLSRTELLELIEMTSSKKAKCTRKDLFFDYRVEQMIAHVVVVSRTVIIQLQTFFKQANLRLSQVSYLDLAQTDWQNTLLAETQHVLTQPLTRLNLLPWRQAISQRKINIMVLCSVFYLLVGGLCFIHQWRHNERALEQVAQTTLAIAHQVQQLRGQQSELEALQQQLDTELKNQQEVDDQLAKYDFLAQLLRQLTTQLPDNIWFNQIMVSGRQITLAGNCQSKAELTDYIDWLAQYPSVSGVALVNLVEQTADWSFMLSITF